MKYIHWYCCFKSFQNEIFSELEVSEMIKNLKNQSLPKNKVTDEEHLALLKKKFKD